MKFITRRTVARKPSKASMSLDFSAKDPAERLNRGLAIVLYRVSGIAMFGAGLFYWVRLVGILPGPMNRFDLMPVYWKMAAPALAVLYPIAGVGLWMTVSWGAVIWMLVIAIEGIMHLVFPYLFGHDLVWLAVQVWFLAMLGGVRLIGWRERRAFRGY